MKLLILGGYGVFGGRLARLLADVEGLELLIAGRDGAKAAAFCKGWPGRARLRPLVLDRADVVQVLADEAPDLIVDASGPFQAYGATPYGVVEAAIAQGVNYMDFADGSDFVSGIGHFDASARAAGVFVLSGVSSFPVLTAAVLAEMAKTMDIQQVRGGIAPSPYAGIGMNVMRAVLGYAGQDVALRRNGAAATGIGLGESLRYTVAVPGRIPLRNLRFSLVDVPDLRLIPAQMPGIGSLWMGAGPVPELLHRLLNLLARLRHLAH
ncbi:saccharopine dehydrogenase NADP-binding domain-containing protein, partial [Pseudorhodobacter sp.]|uniref:saccharopine dehydrogenase NADP-binding domain-containing protein n=1 Tax=Pseudorhodobacter sp. TaxID=1934400 RepID=UPI002649B513